MLFNTAWKKTPEGQPVQPLDDVLSTASLVAWLETKPADKAYLYEKPHNCLLAQYLWHKGHRGCWVGTNTINNFQGKWQTNLSDDFYNTVTPKPHTFGAALKRAKACL